MIRILDFKWNGNKAIIAHFWLALVFRQVFVNVQYFQNDLNETALNDRKKEKKQKQMKHIEHHLIEIFVH